MLHIHVIYVHACKKWEDYNGVSLMSWICTYQKLCVQKYFYLGNAFCVLDIAWDTCQNYNIICNTKDKLLPWISQWWVIKSCDLDIVQYVEKFSLSFDIILVTLSSHTKKLFQIQTFK